MSERQSSRPYDICARKWRELAVRRCQHFVELHQSGRWQHYYTEDQFMAEMTAAMRAAERWARIAPDETGYETRD